MLTCTLRTYITRNTEEKQVIASMGNMLTANHTKIYRLQQPNIEFRGGLENGD